MAVITTTGSKLKIKNGERNGINLFSFGNNYSYVEIYLPKSYTKAMSIKTASGKIHSSLDMIFTDFTAETASGEISFESVNAVNINVSSVSGEINLNNAVADKNVKLKTSSGGIYADYLEAELIELNSVSGEINADETHGKVSAKSSSGDIKLFGGENSITVSTVSGEITAENALGELNISSVSGDINLMSCSGGGKISTTSGEISYDCNELSSSLTMISVSSDIGLTVPDKSAFSFKADTTSGDIETYFDDIASYSRNEKSAEANVGGGSNASVKITTTSGDIDVYSK